MPKFGEWLLGKEEKFKKLPTMNKGQNKLLSGVLQQLQEMIGEGGSFNQAQELLQQYLNPESEIYDEMEQNALQNYEEEDLPQLAERFAGMNAMGGGLSSSGFGQALGASKGKLRRDLAQMRQQGSRQAATDIFSQFNQLTNQALGKDTFAYQNKPGNAGFLAPLAGSAVEAGAKAYMGG